MTHALGATIPVSAVVLTFNEEANLRACLTSLAGLADEIFIVDSGSTDGTTNIASTAGATVEYHPFTIHSEQWSWALANLPLRNDWVFGLDADQRVSPSLAAELRQVFLVDGPPSPEVGGFYIKRRQVFRGRWIRHGGYYPKYLLKLFRRDKVYLDPTEQVDHHFYVERAARLSNDLIEENRNEDVIGFWLQKHLRYAERLADEAITRRGSSLTIRFESLTDPAMRSRVLKRAWEHLPLYWRAVGFFGYRYILRLGFLDGREGFVFHFLQSCWFRVVIDVMIEERLNERRHA